MAALQLEKQRGRYAALAIAAVVIVVGIPLWWKTTETYRAWLPFSDISELDTLQLQLSVDIEVVFSRGTLTPEQQKKVPLSHVSLRYKYETRYRTATVMEEDALNQPSAAEADLSLHMLSESSCGSVVVYVIPESSTLLPEDVKVYVGQRRTALLRSPPFKSSWSLKEVLSSLDVKVEQVVSTMSFNHQDIVAALSDRVRMTKVTKESMADSMRAIKSSPGYEITFSLLNPDPKSHSLHWDIEGAVQSYIQPLLNKLAPIANFSVDSQILYYAVLGVNPRFDNSSNAASSNPVLNFLLYVPDAHHSPLFIRDHSKREVYNVNEMYGPEAERPVDININMAKVMGVFLAQLRLMLGVQHTHPPPGFVLQSPGSAGLADWELDRLLWSRSVENIATASTTITSLAQLLDQIGNIVINDNIAQQVSSAVTSLQSAVVELEAGNLAFALQYSREAILASERAFFDPSLLHLLYFPDDQKFAIYIPLFLPMCVPIVLSLLKIMSEAKQKRAEKQAKSD
ncbi:GPI transamidase component PIG-S [Labeo rohita]|uniref:GPI transamidase component PIG-S n=1 Tax=Labeo rohita TaxID=84645 RepID=A0ABQ8LK77_LABRO|nr:GPI transamidase component PIG-S [Labeo rohita]